MVNLFQFREHAEYADGRETERDTLFKHFGRAFFKQDLDAMYAVVTADFTYSIVVNDVSPLMCTRDQVAAFFIERNDAQQNVRFEDVVLHHADEATFMTYRATGTDLVTNESFERVGVERYSFKDGRIAEKDVYSRPVKRIVKKTTERLDRGCAESAVACSK